MARLRGCRVVFLSVGAGPIYTGAGRLLIRTSLAMADYRSYRDEPSREHLRRIGVRTTADPVYPDLAYALPRELLAPGKETRQRARPVVGLGLMVYPGRYSDASPKPETYTAYVTVVATFAERLIGEGFDIRVLLGDGDNVVIEEFMSELRSRLGLAAATHAVCPAVTSVGELLAQLADTDFVVATRFHNLVFAMLVGKPVISLSFHHKCDSLMKEAGLAAYTHDIHNIDADRLMRQFDELTSHRDEVKRTIAERVDSWRQALDEQCRAVFGASGGRHLHPLPSVKPPVAPSRRTA
jgi:polysaccharide pyruvyl transferase WcaK-like protein